MLAQWISWASRKQSAQARTEPLITLGSAPLDVPEFRAVVRGQLGESRLEAAIDADLAGPVSHAGALDADTKGPLRGIHRRVGSAVFFPANSTAVPDSPRLSSSSRSRTRKPTRRCPAGSFAPCVRKRCERRQKRQVAQSPT